MPIDPDFAREERIKRLRVLVRSGTDQMLVLHDAVPAYERLSSSGEHRMPAVLKAEALMERLPPDVQREQAIRLGYMVAERNHRTFTKIYKWLKLADNGRARGVDVDSITIFRGDVEGNPTALHASITFDSTHLDWRAASECDFSVTIQLFTAGHTVTMLDETDELRFEHLDEPWELMSTSSGVGAIHAGQIRLALVPS